MENKEKEVLIKILNTYLRICNKMFDKEIVKSTKFIEKLTPIFQFDELMKREPKLKKEILSAFVKNIPSLKGLSEDVLFNKIAFIYKYSINNRLTSVSEKEVDKTFKI